MKKYKMKINGEIYEAHIVEFNPHTAKIAVNGVNFDIEFDPSGSDDFQSKIIQVEKTAPVLPEMKAAVTTVIAPVVKDYKIVDESQTINIIKAPIPGVVISLKVKEGDKVKVNDVLLILEAMKMESEISSAFEGTIEKIIVNEKTTVQEGDVLITIKS
jgi:biotin carboxyl carrier protein